MIILSGMSFMSTMGKVMYIAKHISGRIRIVCSDIAVYKQVRTEMKRLITLDDFIVGTYISYTTYNDMYKYVEDCRGVKGDTFVVLDNGQFDKDKYLTPIIDTNKCVCPKCEGKGTINNSTAFCDACFGDGEIFRACRMKEYKIVDIVDIITQKSRVKYNIEYSSYNNWVDITVKPYKNYTYFEWLCIENRSDIFDALKRGGDKAKNIANQIRVDNNISNDINICIYMPFSQNNDKQATLPVVDKIFICGEDCGVTGGYLNFVLPCDSRHMISLCRAVVNYKLVTNKFNNIETIIKTTCPYLSDDAVAKLMEIYKDCTK